MYDDFKLKKTLWFPWFMQKYFSVVRVNPLAAKLLNWNLHSLEVVFRCLDPQLQVSENYSDLTTLRSTNFKSSCLMSLFIFDRFKI